MSQSILIVDDESYIVTSLSYVMKNAGFHVGTAGDGEEALKKVEEMIPDLVILDINMPKKDGFQVCKEIRSNPSWKSVRIVILTARDRVAEKERGLSLGADAYLTKPFSTRDLLVRVKEILSQNSSEN